MQIVVNTRLLIKDRLDGIGWFSYQTLKRITKNNPEVHFVFLFDRAFDEEFIFAPNVTPLVLSPKARHPLLYYIWFQYVVKPLLDRMQPDLFLSPDGFLSLGAKCKQVPVIHDINFHKYPNDSKWLTGKYYNYYFPQFAKAATRIGTVSEFSKSEISKQYGIAPEKIDVLYNGINESFRVFDTTKKQAIRSKHTNGQEYFISVGSLHPRKNIVNLVKAFKIFKDKSQLPHKLVIAGPDFWSVGEIHKAVEESGYKQDIIFTGRLGDEALAELLGAAKALTFVPYYEGFGIPLVEAMAAGVPIITSNVTSLPEVAGDAALLVDPFNTEDIAEAMISLCKDETLCHSLTTKGLKRQKEFSWDRSASLLWDCVQKSIKH